MHSLTLHSAESKTEAEDLVGTMRMAELVERTGVPKTTILFYLKEGLLPPPDKPHPNQALYSDAHVRRLLLIKEAQRTYHYPLANIRRLLAMVERGASPALVFRLGERVGAARPAVQSARHWTFEEFCIETGLDGATVRRALENGILHPLSREDPPEFDAEDVAVGSALRAGRRYGLDLPDLDFLVEHAAAIAEGEMRLRDRIVHDRPINEDLEITADLTDMARTLHTYVVDRMFIGTATRQPVGGVAGEDRAHAPTWTTNKPAWPAT